MMVGLLIVATCAAGCKGHGKDRAQSLEPTKTVKFGEAHYACGSTETLESAESLQRAAKNEEFQNLIRKRQCWWLTAGKDYTISEKDKESKDSIVLGVVEDPTKVSVMAYTRYQFND